jgi:hypothetical protein
MNIFDLVLQSYERKKNEFFQLLIIGLIIWLSLGVKKSNVLGKLVYVSIGLGNRILVNKFFINVTFIFLYIVFFFYMFDKPTLISNLILFNVNDVIYASWFDFGEKDLDISYWSLYQARYWN